ncbi:6-phosphogluconolactonase [Aeromicrobium sp. CTD01-1L150]|uniref:6-phosphogluconolactonase n=1 Tax=Aeromicrobium sp. CTD01-1L150 TaxID=3341830 RepID=UPI0035C1B861
MTGGAKDAAECHGDTVELAEAIARRLEDRIATIQSERRRPRVVLTGGTIALAAYERLRADRADWADVELWFGDERFVPAGHEDRNDRQAADAFLRRLAVPTEHVHSMPAHGCDQSLAEAADQYAQTLPDGPFDLVLLGMGPDGHVASLFPGFAQLHESERDVVEVFGSPKPPPERISLTFRALNRTEAVWFLVAGDGKAGAVARALAADGSLEETPARGVRGSAETLWLLDADAASGLP